jgi:serine/threonine protein kinase
MSNNKLYNEDKNSIPMRIQFIKELLDGGDLEPLVNFDSTETENFICRKTNDDESRDSYDTRVVLRKKIFDFNNIIAQMGGKLKYIKSGTTGHTFKGISEDGKVEYAVKVVAYPKKERYGSINDVRRPENAELMMLKLLSMFIVKRQTPHLIIPYGTFNTNIETFINSVKLDKIDEKNERYKEFLDRHKEGDFSSTVSILISEWANRGDFLDYMRNNYKDFKLTHWKVFFFQLLSVLAIIQSKYPSFRHNDMKANNILVQKIDLNREYYRYLVVGAKYKVPNIGYQIKLWDFDFACIPGIVDNIKVSSKWTKKINITPEQNRYYDVHYFFNTLIRKGFFPQILTDSIVPKEVKDFIDRVVPKKYRDNPDYVHEKGRILINDEYTTPDELLKKDIFFAEFRNDGKVNEKNGEIKYDFNKILSIDRTDNNFLFKNKEIKRNSKKKDSKKEKSRNIDLLKLLGSDVDKTKDKFKYLEEKYLK